MPVKWTTAAATGHPVVTSALYGAALIRAWNAHVRGQKLSIVSGHVRPGVKFPQFVLPVGKGGDRKSKGFRDLNPF